MKKKKRPNGTPATLDVSDDAVSLKPQHHQQLHNHGNKAKHVWKKHVWVLLLYSVTPSTLDVSNDVLSSTLSSLSSGCGSAAASHFFGFLFVPSSFFGTQDLLLVVFF